jgi:hypothetical protein
VSPTISDGSALAIRSAVGEPPAPECQPRSLDAVRERLFCSLRFFATAPGARDRRTGRDRFSVIVHGDAFMSSLSAS